MPTIAIMGPEGSESFLAAKQYNNEASLRCFNSAMELLTAFDTGISDFALVPFYNTREGLINDYFQSLVSSDNRYWVDNIVLPIHLSMGALTESSCIKYIVGRGSVFNQCKDYIKANYPTATLITLQNIEERIHEIKSRHLIDHAVIESEELLKTHALALIDREVVSHNKTRFALLARKPAAPTGFDATAVITKPLKDRVGILVDILGEFTRRGINIIDLRTDNDIESQKLRIYLEFEGHYSDPRVQEVLLLLEKQIIHEQNCLKLLGSFPRVEMRIKRIKSFGFIGTGDMSKWFSERLQHEGYSTILTGRSSEISPMEMIPRVDVVIICVPISVTGTTIQTYAPHLLPGQALILLAGESEHNLQIALDNSREDVEVMLVHNLWGPQAATMKDKNVAVVRTHRSGKYCSEFEAFLYKHGAEIYRDSAIKHDILMGVGQKLPTMISVALAATLAEHQIDSDDIGSHSTLTSIYGILAMARIHIQHPRTYAEIMATKGEGRTIAQSFVTQLANIIALAEHGEIEKLCEVMEKNKNFFAPEFLQKRMQQAKAVDDVLKESGYYYD